jgi:hypothetical protein
MIKALIVYGMESKEVMMPEMPKIGHTISIALGFRKTLVVESKEYWFDDETDEFQFVVLRCKHKDDGTNKKL